MFLKSVEFIEKFNSSISERFKSIITIVSFQIITLFFIIFLYLDGRKSFSLTMIIGAVLTGILVLTHIKKVEKLKVNKYLAIPYLVAALSFIISGLYMKVLAYLAIGLVMAVIIPLYWYTSLSYEKDYFLYRISIASIITYILIIIASFILGIGIDTYKYPNLFGNSNGNANFLIFLFPLVLYFYSKSKTQKGKDFSVIIMSIILFELFFLKSRTGYVSLFLILIAYYIQTRKKMSFSIKGFLRKIILFIVGISIIVFTRSNIVRFDFSSSGESNFEFNKSIRYISAKATKGFDGEKSIDSGRFEIWKNFIDSIGFKGHPKITMKINTEYTKYEKVDSHNAYIEIAYATGIIGGAAFALFIILLSFFYLKEFLLKIKTNDFKSELVLETMLFIGFFIHSMLATSYYPYIYPVAFGFFYSISNKIFKVIKE